MIDVQYRTVGTTPKPFWEAVKEFPTSCGEVGWQAVRNIVPLLAQFRARGWPVPPETEVTEEAVLRFNTPEVREVGVPGGGVVTGAADLALFYQALLAGGKAADGRQVWSPETVADARRVRTGDFVDPMFGKRANRGLGITIAGDADRVFRGFGRTNSE